MEVKDARAVVTGAASGIGLGIVRALVAAGATGVVIADVDEAGAERAAAEVRAAGVKAVARACDVSIESEVEALADVAWSEFGGVDLVFNNAGVTAPGNPMTATEQDTRWEFDVNTFGVIHGTRVFGRRLLASGDRGWVCNTASHNAIGAPFPDVAGYVGSKHAVVGYTDAMHVQFGDRIGFSVLCPGPINTEVWDAGRARPLRFGGPIAGNPSNQKFLQKVGMDPRLVGEKTVKGVRDEQFFIFTHPEDIELIRQRYVEARACVVRQFPAYQPN